MCSVAEDKSIRLIRTDRLMEAAHILSAKMLSTSSMDKTDTLMKTKVVTFNNSTLNQMNAYLAFSFMNFYLSTRNGVCTLTCSIVFPYEVCSATKRSHSNVSEASPI